MKAKLPPKKIFKKGISQKLKILFLIIGFLIPNFAPIALKIEHKEAQASEGPNLISNPSLETSDSSGLPQDWARGRWGTNQAIFTYPVAGSDGAKGAKVEMTSYTSGDAKWYFKEVAVTPGKTYTFSDQYIATVTTYLTAQFHMSNGSYQYVDLATINPASSWQSTQTTLTIPSNVSTITIFHLIKSVGYLSTDNFSLKEIISDPVPDPTPIPTPTPTSTQSSNLISNPSLETSDSSGLPQDWARGRWGTNQAIFTYPVAGSDGSRGAKVEMTSYTSGDAKWYFKEVAVTPGTSYTFSNDYIGTSPSYVTIQFHKSDGSYSYNDIAALGSGSSWQHFTKTFTAPSGVTALTIFHLIKSLGSLTIDNYSLTTSTSGTPPPPPPPTDDPSKFNEGMVSLNFDDGYKATYQNALPILNNAGVKSTQYIVTGRFTFGGYVNENDVLDMQSHGHEIGAHTRTHPYLTSLSETDMESEIRGSKDDLLGIGVTKVDTFAYPFGDYNNTTDKIVRKTGYSAVRTSDGGFNKKNSNKYLLARQPVMVYTSVDQVKSWIDTAVNDKSWLILVFHNVDYTGTEYSSTPETLKAILDYLALKNVRVVTNSVGASMMP